MDETNKKVIMHLQSAQNRLLIKNGQVVNHDGSQFADVYIEDGIVKQIGKLQLFVNLIFILYARWRFKFVCLQTKLASLAIRKKISNFYRFLT